MNTTKATMIAPIFLLGSHKSGSSLLRSLFDGHRDLFAIPTEIHYFQYTGHWVDYKLRRSWPKQMNRSELIQSLTQLVEEKNTFNEDSRYADSILAGKLDVSRFKNCLENSYFETRRELFEAYVAALHSALTGKPLPEGIRIVEKSVENAECAVQLRQMFPDCYFVHIVRNPYASLVAIRKSKAKGNYPVLRDLLLSLHNSYYNLYRNETVLDRYLTIRYEDLLTSTESIVQKIADFIGIEFTDILLKPTLMGEPWGGNSTSGNSFNNISSAPLESWKSQITDLEIRLVNNLLEPVIERFGYERMTPTKPKLFPTQGENFKTYIQNRSLLWLS